MNKVSIHFSPYTQESKLEQVFHQNISHFWRSREEGKLISFDKKRIFWCRFTHQNHHRMILIMNGRMESTWKYQELFYDLFQLGYDIYSFDHRGQGLSDRLTENRQIGHVDEFQDYVRDLELILNSFELSRYQSRFLLAHSMGGTIATRYIQTHPKHPFHALALTAPMLGLNLPWYIRPCAIPLTQIWSGIVPKTTYAPGYQAYESKPFENNLLSHSRPRYDRFRKLYEEMPELQLGGPSLCWVWQSLIGIKQSHQLTRQITLPTLILQAGCDTIVNNDSQIRFHAKLAKINPQCKLVHIPGAKHELLFESDRYRNRALDMILEHFSSLS
jgi:lysophospholipase